MTALQSVLFLQHVLNGLLAGTYYLLIALGLSLIFSLGGIVNLAHGAFYAIGAYLTVVLSPTIGFGGSIVASPILVGILGVIIERTLFRRFYKADPSLSLILTFGLAMVAEQALRMIFGAPPLSYSIPQELRGQLFIGSFIYPYYRVLGVGLAGLAGVMLAPIFSIHPAMGSDIITAAFVVVVIGGLGSFWGVVVAAMIVGLVKGLVVALGYPQFSEAAMYVLMLFVLLVRPRGLFGERIQRFE